MSITTGLPTSTITLNGKADWSGSLSPAAILRGARCPQRRLFEVMSFSWLRCPQRLHFLRRPIAKSNFSLYMILSLGIYTRGSALRHSRGWSSPYSHPSLGQAYFVHVVFLQGSSPSLASSAISLVLQGLSSHEPCSVR